MKIFLTLIVLSIFSAVKAQDVPTILDSLPVYPTELTVNYDTVINVPGTKEELYLKSKLWLVSMFPNPKEVIQTEDRVEGFITGRGILNFIYTHVWGYKKSMRVEKNPSVGNAYFNFKIFAKDGKAKMTISNLELFDDNVYSRNELILNDSSIAKIKRKAGGDMISQAQYKTDLSRIRGLHNEILSTFAAWRQSLLKKAESDF